ncbi:glycosyltransferase [Variovorax paradoxus]|uniref:glycosyltransferase n=1 Tax=Variovorax paradoxus TaxID=34073 RepID=UPI000408D1BB|nr:glycosyltransferase [Variovorax paradoxus]
MLRRPSFDRSSTPTGLAVFTICASNYLAHAAVLGASLRRHQPGTTLLVFLLDEPPEGTKLPEHVILLAAEMAFERTEWNHRRSHYSLLEFATSVKPACFRYLLDQGVARAVYLDPDIQVFQRLDQFWQGTANDPELVLTPHTLSPLPDDGYLPDDLTILRAGLYNLGFAALRDTPRVRELLQWWDRKLRTLCLEDVHAGVFTDQKWMDYAPLLVPGACVLRHKGFNAAYWNLHERTPRWLDERWWMQDEAGDAQKLVLFHFSGFNPDLKQLSRHESRFGWNLPGDAGRLFGEYAQSLLDAGIHRFRALGLPQVAFADGTGWDPVCRAVYRQALAKGVDLGDPLEDPAFLLWAAAEAPGDHLTRYLRAVLHMRGDLVNAFADGRDTVGLMTWMRTSGVRELGLDRKVVERLGMARQAQRISVNYVGYLQAHLGVGEAARNSVAALDAAGVAVHCHDISCDTPAPTGRYSLPAARWTSETPTATILGCNADMLPDVLSKLPAELLTPYRIGCWYWETPEFPSDWADRFEMVDEIWAGTRFIADAIRCKTTLPVNVMPPMVMPPPMQRDREWLAAMLPEIKQDEFVFLFQFDVASVPYRKNPEGVVATFVRAFRPSDAVRLIVKALNVQAAPTLIQSLHEAAAGHRVSFLTAAMESDDRFRLLASVDSFVSLHRSEGFGLSIAEAMAYGLPVVATDWSGNVDFTHAGNAALVPYDLVPSAVANGPYPAGTLWAEPKLEAAAKLMRRLWLDPAWRAQIAQAGQQTIVATFSASVVGPAMRDRLDQVAGLRRGQSAPQQRQSPQSGPKAAAARNAPLWARVLLDMLRYPGYYFVRLPRVPVLLWRHGISGVVMRAELVASTIVDVKGQYLVTRILTRLRERIHRWRYGGRRVR